MARKRMIDPSLWQDEGMAELTARQQLLYIGMFSNADDEGRLKGSASAIRLTLPTLYAGTDLAEIDVDVAAVLLAMRQITRYEAAGRTYLAFRNYRKWQKIERPSPSVLPAPPDDCDDSPNDHRTITESSPTVRPQVKLIEEKEGEEKERDVPPSSPPAPLRPDPAPPGGGGRKIRPVPRPSTLSRKQQERFDRWYPTYPNKQHRPEAEKAFAKLDPDDALTDRLIADTTARQEGRKWGGGGGERYIELPATYLSNRVWEDDIEPVRAGPARASPNGQHQSNEQAKFTRSIAALQGVGGHRGPADIPEEHGETGRRALGRGHA